MSREQVPFSTIQTRTGWLSTGLAAGLTAALLLSLLDWWLMLRQGNRGVDGQSIAALCYAYLLLGVAGAVGGVVIAMADAAVARVARPLQFKRTAAYPSPAWTIWGICLAGGGALLIRFGWMPQWFRSDQQRFAADGPRFIALLFGLAVLGVLFSMAARKLWRRPPGHGTAVVAVVMLLVHAGAGLGWMLSGSGSDPSGVSVHTSPARPAGAAEVDGPPVLILLLDTLRWDSLSCYGNGDFRTPHLDRFCREAVQFEVARAQASWTKPSIATLLTSTHPRVHGARGRADRISSSAPALAGLFRRAGYRTGAVVANGNLSPAFGFARGFDEYRYLRPDFALGARGRALGLGVYRIASAAWQLAARGRREHRYFKRDAAEVNSSVLDWLHGLSSGERRRFFLFVNYVDPHDPYFRHPYDGHALGAVDSTSPSAGVRDEMAALYDGEVVFLDRHLGRLFAHLRRLGLYDRLLIVVTSDHGEEFLDHGGWWHGLTLFEEQVRVPLMVRLPGGTSGGRRAGGEAGLIDVAPGLLELAGLASSTPRSMSGRSLACWLQEQGEGEAPSPQSFHADEKLDGNVLSSLTEGRWKYVRANPGNPRGLPREALYDVVEDPGERLNQVQRHPELAAAMSARLDRLHSRGPGGAGEPPSAELDEETSEHLRALGYLN